METTFPRGFKEIKYLYLSKGIGQTPWPDWCYMPIHFVINNDTFCCCDDAKDQDEFYTLLDQLVLLNAAATWRLSKGIYKFDQDLYKELIGQVLQGDLPTEHLLHLPEWCIYIETPGMDGSDGFMALLNYNLVTEQPELTLVVFTDIGELTYSLPLGNWDIDKALDINISRNIEAIERLREGAPIGFEKTDDFKNALEREKKEHKDVFECRLNLLLYLCSDNADLPVIPSYKHRIGTKRIMAAKEHRVWDVGIRIGAAIRKYREQEDPATQRDYNPHNSPRPHIRRAHWHSFWKGKKSDPTKRDLILHWLPPIPVMVDDNELPAVIRVVE